MLELKDPQQQTDNVSKDLEALTGEFYVLFKLKN
jgi:hypothetical protein